MIELFDREFVETQEACGMRILGQFRDEDDPDRFVWIRAFTGMEERAAALTAFYLDGDVWRQHAPAARETMVDTDNAMLLRPLSGFETDGERPRPGATVLPRSRLTANVCYLGKPADVEFVELFEERIRPILTGTGAPPVAWFATEAAPNTFPQLPVRTGEHVFAWFTRFDSTDERDKHRVRLEAEPGWRELQPVLSGHFAAPMEALRLAPTSRSLLR